MSDSIERAKRAIEARNAYLEANPGDAVGGMMAALNTPPSSATPGEVEQLKDDLASLAWSSHPRGMDYMGRQMKRVYALLDSAATQPQARAGSEAQTAYIVGYMQGANDHTPQRLDQRELAADALDAAAHDGYTRPQPASEQGESDG